MPPGADQKVSVRLGRTLVLVGLMGAGKTSVGRRLADVLQVDFADSDHEIELAAGLEVREIFERYGEVGFREGEVRVIRRLLAQPPCVLATGGGAFLSPVLREEIAAAGLSVWLDAELETLWQRVKDRSTRPLLQQPEPRKVLADLLEARRPIYAQATLRVPSEAGISHDLMVWRILEAVRRHDLAHPDQAPTLERTVGR